MKKVEYGIISIRNGIPMIKWIPKKHVKNEKKLFKTFYSKDIFPILLKAYPRKDIREDVNFEYNIFYKIIPATYRESYVTPIKVKDLKDEKRKI